MVKCKNCIKKATFGAPGTKKPLSCKFHKDDGHVDVVKRNRCDYSGCTKRANFGPDGGKPTRCSDHKDDGHVDVRNRRCNYPGCTKQPSFGPEGGNPTRCSAHKDNGHVDVASRRCDHPGCTKHPSFAPEGSKRTRCSAHKDDDHVDVKKRKMCDHIGCTKRSTFGPRGGKSTQCSDHKDDDHVNVVNQRCESLGCSVYDYYQRPFASRINPNTNKTTLCCFCWRRMYPHLDNHVKVRKEFFVLAEIQRQIPELEPYFLVHDCKIPGQSCVTARPDMCWVVNYTMIHVEIDENGDTHEDDDDRLVAIHSATEAINHICIRFNPDKTKNHASCFKRLALGGGGHILRKNDSEWDRRMGILIPNIREVFEKCIDNLGETVAGKRKLCF